MPSIKEFEEKYKSNTIAKSTATKEVNEVVNAIFAELGIHSIAVKTYVPSFNDGDPCVRETTVECRIIPGEGDTEAKIVNNELSIVKGKFYENYGIDEDEDEDDLEDEDALIVFNTLSVQNENTARAARLMYSIDHLLEIAYGDCLLLGWEKTDAGIKFKKEDYDPGY